MKRLAHKSINCCTIMLMEESSNEAKFAQISEADQKTVSWTASEYISHEKSASWHGLLFVVAGIMTLAVYIISHDILAGIVILLSASAMSVYAKKKPQQKSYELNSEGVAIDNQFFSYDGFRSFSIIEEGAIDSIWLKPLKRLSPTVVIYFPTDQLDEIEELLSKFLPFEEKSLDLIDRATKRIRF